MSTARERDIIEEELEFVWLSLAANHNDIMLSEMKQLIYELSERNRTEASTSAEVRQARREQFKKWSIHFQTATDRQNEERNEVRATPKEPSLDFDGTNAQAFWASYQASVFLRPGMTDRVKMLHLVARVSKTQGAAQLVAGYPSDGSQLAECLSAFQQQYLNEREMQSQLMKEAKALPSLNKVESSETTATFINQVRSIASRMTLYKAGDESDHHAVMREVISKLSASTRYRFADYHYPKSDTQVDHKPTNILQALVTFLTRKEGVESLMRFMEGSRPEKTKEREKRGEKRASSTSETQDTKRWSNAKVLATIANKACAICHQASHMTEKCEAFDADERYRRLKAARICIKCLMHPYEFAKPCNNPVTCHKCNNGAHHPVICRKVDSPANVTNAVTIMECPQGNVTISTLRAVIVCGNKRVVGQVIFDEAAQTSLISSRMQDQLQAETHLGHAMTLHGTGKGCESLKHIVNFEVVALDDSFRQQIWAYLTPNITSMHINHPSEEAYAIAKSMGIPLQDRPKHNTHIDVLIGQDFVFAFRSRPGQIIPMGPLMGAFKSTLGWYIAGNEWQMGQTEETNAQTGLNPECLSCQDLTRVLDSNELWDVIKDDRDWTRFVSSIEYEHEKGVYSVRLPLRTSENLGTNYHNARNQVEALRRRLKQTKEYEEYDRAIRSYVEAGFAEVVRDPSVTQGMYFIPHHGVRKTESQTTKLRVVFNASSATVGKRSLNQCLSKGDSINSDIWGVTIKMRLAPILLVTDLVKAFSQIRVHPDDRDWLRYLWYETPEDATPQMYRMASVIFGATSSPFLLGAVLRAHCDRFKADFPELVKELRGGLYMDDAALAANSLQEARDLIRQAPAFFQRASFQLHPWITNAAELCEEQDGFGKMTEVHRCFGLRWHPGQDTLSLSPLPEMSRDSHTPRQAVSLLSKLYDPVGWFTPIKTRIRLYIRALAVKRGQWDRTLDPSEEIELCRLWEEAQAITQHNLNRTREWTDEATLHIFCDASAQAMATAAYLVGPKRDQRLLIAAKVKLAPKQTETLTPHREQEKIKATIPRLELVAALMGAKMKEALQGHLNVPTAFYSDSLITIQRIQGDPNKLDPFEMRRIHDILEVSNAEQWHHISTKLNPADIPTRNVPIKTWISNPMWWRGPDVELFQNAKPSSKRESMGCVVALEEDVITDSDDYTLAVEDLRRQWSNKTARDGEMLDRLNQGKTRPQDIDGLARMSLWRRVQRETMPEELQRLQTGQDVGRRSTIHQLRPFLDEWGVIRVRRIAQLLELDWEARHPILLRSHLLVRSFLRVEHERSLHRGMRDFRNQLELYFHLVHARRIVRSVIGSCVQCNFRKGKPFVVPAPDLPDFRVQCDGTPFSHIGLDYAGPIQSRDKAKVYVLLATCAVTRGVHLEATTSTDTEQCLQALERLFARRGIPREIHSDNATTFKAADKAFGKMARLIQEATQTDRIRHFNIHWVFQTPRAPWCGGFFERMVKTVKECLKATHIKRTFDLEEIGTILCQVEAIVNSRPLVEANPEGENALTPAHFLVGRSLTAIPPFPGKVSQTGMFDRVMRNYLGLRSVQDAFWNRFKRDYICQLQRYQRQPTVSREPRVGELVLVAQEDRLVKGRTNWPLARITQLFPGRDGIVRTVEIEANGKRYTRAVQLLVPLESTRADIDAPPPEDVMAQLEQWGPRVTDI